MCDIYLSHLPLVNILKLSSSTINMQKVSRDILYKLFIHNNPFSEIREKRL